MKMKKKKKNLSIALARPSICVLSANGESFGGCLLGCRPILIPLVVMLGIVVLQQLVGVGVLQVVLAGRPHARDCHQDRRVQHVPEGVKDPERVPTIVERVRDDHHHLPRDPRRGEHDGRDEDVREAAIERELGRLLARQQLRERAREAREDPPVEGRVQEGDGQDEEQAQRHRDVRDRRDVRDSVQNHREGEVDNAKRDHARTIRAEGRTDDAVAERDNEHEEARDGLLHRARKDAHHDRPHAARARRVEGDVVKVPRRRLDHPEGNHAGDAILQAKQLAPVARAQDGPEHAEPEIYQRHDAEEGEQVE
mmetsp:Transcript_746/g.2310  ORF Transcript_746/g.2310 Transcript_746/m.2310 type:complete len:310 (+) Transcript_746:79-1008(+)